MLHKITCKNVDLYGATRVCLLLLVGAGAQMACHHSSTDEAMPTSCDWPELQHQLHVATQDLRATVGVCIAVGDTLLTLNDTVHYPLMSVFKLHVAAATFAEMQRRGDSLSSSFTITATDLCPDTYSPLRDSLPQGGRLTMSTLLYYMLALSDNNACNWLIGYAGGISQVQSYLHDTLGITDCALSESETTMRTDVMRCYNNWATPSSVVSLLRLLLEDTMLTDEHRNFLLHTLESSTTGRDKLRAGLPPTVPLAHKTGHSPRLENGIRIAEADAGCFLLPDSTPCYLAVLVCNSYEDDTTNAAIFSTVTRRLTAELNGTPHRHP